MSNQNHQKFREKKHTNRITGMITASVILVFIISGWFLIQDAIIFTSDGMEFVPEVIWGDRNAAPDSATAQATLPHATTAITGDAQTIDFEPLSAAELDVEEVTLPTLTENAGRIGRRLAFSEYVVPDFGATVRALSASGEETVIFDVKQPSGKLAYTSALSLAQKANANATSTEDFYLRDAVKCLNDVGIKTAARISCFADSRLADAEGDMILRDDAGLPCRNSEGFALLDPENSELREYLTSVVQEVVALGFDTIVLDDLAYPSDVEGNQDALLALMEQLDMALGDHELVLAVYPATMYTQDISLREMADALWAYQKGLGAGYYLNGSGILFHYENQ